MRKTLKKPRNERCQEIEMYYRRLVNNQLIKQNYNNNKHKTLIFISFMKCLIIYMH